MKNVLILTITDNNNYGNRLQNYAVCKILESCDCNPYTIWIKSSLRVQVKENIQCFVPYSYKFRRKKNFVSFTNKYIQKRLYKSYSDIPASDNFDKLLIGSDQIWNFKWQLFRNEFITKLEKDKIFSFAASFGVLNIEENENVKSILNNIGKISVREESGVSIIKTLTNRDDVEVLIDPTMLLNREEWQIISKKPRALKNEKYILIYFLGIFDNETSERIYRFARENNCEVISILDKDSPYYSCGPSEFLYLEEHAFLIFTDSFHSSIFSFLFNRPFVIFKRDDIVENDMYTRLDTLIRKFNLEDRAYDPNNTFYSYIQFDYTEGYKQLEIERKKAIDFLKKALED